jgi:aspartate/glutamate racemase
MGIKQATKSVVGMIVSEYRINWTFASSPELPARSAAHGQNAPVPLFDTTALHAEAAIRMAVDD